MSETLWVRSIIVLRSTIRPWWAPLFKKINLHGEFTNFGVQRFNIYGRFIWLRLLITAKNIVCPSKKLIAPLFNLVRMNIVLLSKIAKHLISVNGWKCSHRLEIGCVITAQASCNDSSPFDGKVCQLQVKNLLILTVQIFRATSFANIKTCPMGFQ